MHSRLIRGFEGLEALRSGWEQLDQSAAVPMQQFIWAEACATAFTEDGELRILTLEDDGRLLAIAPLVQRKGHSALELLGVHELHEPTDILSADSQTLVLLAKALVDVGLPLVLRRIPAYSPFVKALEKAFKGRGLIIFRQDHPWSWTPLDARSVTPEKQLTAKQRADFNRKLRIAGEMGFLSAEILSPTPSTLEPLLAEAFGVEAASWKGKLRTAMATDPVRGPFNRCYAAAACKKGILRLCFLRIGQQAAAMQIGIEFGGRFWLLKIGYDPQFARCSPGMLLLRETVRHAAMKGLESLEILGTIDPRTRMWAPLEKTCLVARGYPFGFRGVTTLAGDVAISAWEKLSQAGVALLH